MLPQQQQQRIDELTREMEAMRLQLKQLQHEHERVHQQSHGNAEDPFVATGDGQKVVANVNKWTCNPLLGAAVNYALTTGKRVLDKQIIPKSSTVKNQLTSLLRTFDAKLTSGSQNYPSIKNTISRVKTCSVGTQTHVAPCTTDEKIEQPTLPTRSAKGSDKTVNQQEQRALKVQDALSYLDDIRLAFTDRPEVYNMFLDIMKEFKSGIASTPGVVTKVKQLFDGHPKLIIGLNTFLPPSHQINIEAINDETVIILTPGPVIKDKEDFVMIKKNDVDSSSLTVSEVPVETKVTNQAQEDRSIDYSQVDDYVKKVQDRFQKEPEKLKCFSKILQTFEEKLQNQVTNGAQDNDEAEKELLEQITKLFGNNEDLVKEFTKYLGYNSEAK